MSVWLKKNNSAKIKKAKILSFRFSIVLIISYFITPNSLPTLVNAAMALSK